MATSPPRRMCPRLFRTRRSRDRSSLTKRTRREPEAASLHGFFTKTGTNAVSDDTAARQAFHRIAGPIDRPMECFIFVRRLSLHVREPCHESWDAMPGDDRTRYCDRCRKEVHDLSARTADEAEDLLTAARRNGTRLCVRFAIAATVTLTAACSTSDPSTQTSSHAAPSESTPIPAASTSPSPSPSTSTSTPPRHLMGCVCQPGDPLCSCL